MKKKVDISVVIMAAVVAVVVVLGAIAIAPSVRQMVENKKSAALTERLSNGTATLADFADTEGMTFEEFVTKYGVAVEDASEDMTYLEFMDILTLENYCKFVGFTYTEEELEAFKATNEAAKDLTADSTDSELKAAFAEYLRANEEAEEQAAAQAAAAEAQAATGEAEAPVEESAE